MKRTIAGTVMVLLSACGGHAVDVGSRAALQGSPGLSGSPSESCANGWQLPMVGTWDGYIATTKFPSGSSAIRVVVTHANGELACGSVTFGDRAPLPPVDPSAAYPPALAAPGAAFALPWVLAEGFAMPFVDAPMSNDRVTLSLRYAELWRPWCQLQTPESQISGTPLGGMMTTFDCATRVVSRQQEVWPYGFDCFRDDEPYSCGKKWLCDFFCECDARRCDLGNMPPNAAEFHDLPIDLDFGPEATGSFHDWFRGDVPIYLEQTE